MVSYNPYLYNLEYGGINHQSPQSYKVENIYCVCQYAAIYLFLRVKSGVNHHKPRKLTIFIVSVNTLPSVSTGWKSC